MEASLGDKLGFVERFPRVETTLSGGGCNILTFEADIEHPCEKVWLSSEGDNACIRRVVWFTTVVLHDHLVLYLLGALARSEDALQQCAHGRPIGFVQTDESGWALLCGDK